MSLKLSNGQSVTVTAAVRHERNLLHSLRIAGETADILDTLWSQRALIEATCAGHLGLPVSSCAVQPMREWRRGQFNVCVLVHILHPNRSFSKKVFRCPLPHKVGENYRHSATEEKVRTEVANYAFAEAHCPEIPIPGLVGFGLSGGQALTHERHLPVLQRCLHRIRRLFHSLLRRPAPSHFVPRSWKSPFSRSYMLVDFIDENTGTMLSDTWDRYRQDDSKRENLFRGLSRIMLLFSRMPQTHIGSLRMDDNGYVVLANPPALCANTILESEGNPRTVNGLYSITGSFVSSLLRFRNMCLQTQPNAAYDEEDCRLQMSHLLLLQAIMPLMIDVDYSGPFLLQYTDLHASNIFVDEDWNITGVIDLEFVSALPPGMLNVPYWISAESIDELGSNLQEHEKTCNHFMRIFEEEGRHIGENGTLAGNAVRTAWSSGAYWFYSCLTSVNAIPNLVEDHIYPRFGFAPSLSEQATFARFLSHFWAERADEIVEQKTKDMACYIQEVHALYDTAGSTLLARQRIPNASSTGR